MEHDVPVFDLAFSPDGRLLGTTHMTGRVSVYEVASGRKRRGYVGHPLPGVSVRVVDPESGAPLAPGSPGLVLVKGPNVMRGYLGRDDLTSAVMRETRRPVLSLEKKPMSRLWRWRNTRTRRSRRYPSPMRETSQYCERPRRR